MEEEKKKDNFLLYNNDYSMLEELSDEDVGNVIKNIFKYSINKDIPKYEKGSGKSMLFKHIQRTIDINNKKYTEKCARNKEKALKRWKKIFYDNQDFTKETFIKYCNEKGLNEDFDSILLDEKKMYDDADYASIKEIYNNKGISNETIDKYFQ